MSKHEYLVFGLLDALLGLAERRTTEAQLALRFSVPVADIEEKLEHLRRRRLVHPQKLKLTMSGLAAASALRSAQTSTSVMAA